MQEISSIGQVCYAKPDQVTAFINIGIPALHQLSHLVVNIQPDFHIMFQRYKYICISANRRVRGNVFNQAEILWNSIADAIGNIAAVHVEW